MTISILGCGWFGMALGGALVKEGITVKGTTTSAEKIPLLTAAGMQAFLLQVDADALLANLAFFQCDILVISIPPKFRKGETADYLPKVKNIIQAAEQAGITKVIYISSTGVYGDHNSEVNEFSDPLPDSGSGRILLEAEQLLQNHTVFQTTLIRFGGLVGPGRHPGRFFAGKKNIPNGNAPVNLIHLDDCVGIALTIIHQNVFGKLINAVSPYHPPKAEFYTRAARQAGLSAPEFVDEPNQWKIIDSIEVPALGYQFLMGKLLDRDSK